MITEKNLGISPISQTLLIPLAARAKEYSHTNPIVSDKKSVEFLEKMDTSDFIVDGGRISTLGILARTKIIDEEITKLMESASGTVIITLGVGLDTRFYRFPHASVTWYDLDLPEVIELRKEFVSEKVNINFIKKSVLDASWINDIKVDKKDMVIIIAEGLFMYFSENDVKRIFEMIFQGFPKSHIFFDVVHSFFVNKKISSEFLWGIDKAEEIEHLNHNIKIVQSWSMGDLFKWRQSLPLRILNVIPSTKNRSQIIHCKCTGECEEEGRCQDLVR